MWKKNKVQIIFDTISSFFDILLYLSLLPFHAISAVSWSSFSFSLHYFAVFMWCVQIQLEQSVSMILQIQCMCFYHHSTYMTVKVSALQAVSNVLNFWQIVQFRTIQLERRMLVAWHHLLYIFQCCNVFF